MREVTKPVILIGTGRSGSTAVHRLLSQHPGVAWLSGLCDRFPRKPRINRLLMQAIDLPLIGLLLERRYRPSESYLFWQEYARGFPRPFRDLVAADVTEREKKILRHVLAESLTHSRSRLLLKITGWPRIGYLTECFPDAKFVHLVRDGRAVANSMLAVPFWDGWRGPMRWRWDALPPDQQSAWEANGRSFVALAGIEWVMMQAAVEKASHSLPASQFLQIRYEDFCAAKVDTMRQVIQFAELDWTPDFAHRVERYPAKSANFKWRTELTESQQSILQEVEQAYLEKYGYLS
ncbi:MAG: sulfotransferase [Candidatus Poribacteria bacterium]|nr:sulfotransferase [Candidatus Poribacteria bacterium]